MILHRLHKQSDGNQFKTIFELLSSLKVADRKLEETFNLLEQAYLIDLDFSEAETILNNAPEHIILSDPRIQKILELEPSIKNSRIEEYIKNKYKQTYEFIKRLAQQAPTSRASDAIVIDTEGDTELTFDLPETTEGQPLKIGITHQFQRGVSRYPTTGDKQTLIERARQFYRSKIGLSTPPGTIAVETYVDNQTNTTYIVVLPITKVGYGETQNAKRYYIKDKNTHDIKHVIVDKDGVKPFYTTDTSQAVIYEVKFVQNQGKVSLKLSDITTTTDYNTIQNRSKQIIKQVRSTPIFGFSQRTGKTTVSHFVEISDKSIGVSSRGAYTLTSLSNEAIELTYEQAIRNTLQNYGYFVELQKGAVDVFQLISLSEFNTRFGTLLRTNQEVRIAIEQDEVITDDSGQNTSLQVIEGFSLQLQRGFRYYDSSGAPMTHAFIRTQSDIDFETAAITAVAIDIRPRYTPANIQPPSNATNNEQDALSIISQYYQTNKQIPSLQAVKKALSAKRIQASDQEIINMLAYFQKQLHTLFASKPEFLISYHYPNDPSIKPQTFSLQLRTIRGIIGWTPLPEMANIYLATQESIEKYEDLWQGFLRQGDQRKQWKNSEDDLRDYFAMQGIASGIDPAVISNQLEPKLPRKVKRFFEQFIKSDLQSFDLSEEYAYFLNAYYDKAFSDKLTELAKSIYGNSIKVNNKTVPVISYQDWREYHTYSSDPTVGAEQWYADNIFNWFSVLAYLMSPTQTTAPAMARASEMLARLVSNTQFVSLFEPVPFNELPDFFAGWLEILESFVKHNYNSDAFFNHWLTNPNPPQAWQNKPWFKQHEWKRLLSNSQNEKAEGVPFQILANIEYTRNHREITLPSRFESIVSKEYYDFDTQRTYTDANFKTDLRRLISLLKVFANRTPTAQTNLIQVLTQIPKASFVPHFVAQTGVLQAKLRDKKSDSVYVYLDESTTGISTSKGRFLPAVIYEIAKALGKQQEWDASDLYTLARMGRTNIHVAVPFKPLIANTYLSAIANQISVVLTGEFTYQYEQHTNGILALSVFDGIQEDWILSPERLKNAHDVAIHLEKTIRLFNNIEVVQSLINQGNATATDIQKANSGIFEFAHEIDLLLSELEYLSGIRNDVLTVKSPVAGELLQIWASEAGYQDVGDFIDAVRNIIQTIRANLVGNNNYQNAFTTIQPNAQKLLEIYNAYWRAQSLHLHEIVQEIRTGTKMSQVVPIFNAPQITEYLATVNRNNVVLSNITQYRIHHYTVSPILGIRTTSSLAERKHSTLFTYPPTHQHSTRLKQVLEKTLNNQLLAPNEQTEIENILKEYLFGMIMSNYPYIDDIWEMMFADLTNPNKTNNYLSNNYGWFYNTFVQYLTVLHYNLNANQPAALRLIVPRDISFTENEFWNGVRNIYTNIILQDTQWQKIIQKQPVFDENQHFEIRNLFDQFLRILPITDDDIENLNTVAISNIGSSVVAQVFDTMMDNLNRWITNAYAGRLTPSSLELIKRYSSLLRALYAPSFESRVVGVLSAVAQPGARAYDTVLLAARFVVIANNVLGTALTTTGYSKYAIQFDSNGIPQIVKTVNPADAIEGILLFEQFEPLLSPLFQDFGDRVMRNLVAQLPAIKNDPDTKLIVAQRLISMRFGVIPDTYIQIIKSTDANNHRQAVEETYNLVRRLFRNYNTEFVMRLSHALFITMMRLTNNHAIESLYKDYEKQFKPVVLSHQASLQANQTTQNLLAGKPEEIHDIVKQQSANINPTWTYTFVKDQSPKTVEIAKADLPFEHQHFFVLLGAAREFATPKGLEDPVRIYDLYSEIKNQTLRFSESWTITITDPQNTNKIELTLGRLDKLIILTNADQPTDTPFFIVLPIPDQYTNQLSTLQSETEHYLKLLFDNQIQFNEAAYAYLWSELEPFVLRTKRAFEAETEIDRQVSIRLIGMLSEAFLNKEAFQKTEEEQETDEEETKRSKRKQEKLIIEIIDPIRRSVRRTLQQYAIATATKQAERRLEHKYQIIDVQPQELPELLNAFERKQISKLVRVGEIGDDLIDEFIQEVITIALIKPPNMIQLLRELLDEIDTHYKQLLHEPKVNSVYQTFLPLKEQILNALSIIEREKQIIASGGILSTDAENALAQLPLLLNQLFLLEPLPFGRFTLFNKLVGGDTIVRILNKLVQSRVNISIEQLPEVADMSLYETRSMFSLNENAIKSNLERPVLLMRSQKIDATDPNFIKNYLETVRRFNGFVANLSRAPRTPEEDILDILRRLIPDMPRLNTDETKIREEAAHAGESIEKHLTYYDPAQQKEVQLLPIQAKVAYIIFGQTTQKINQIVQILERLVPKDKLAEIESKLFEATINQIFTQTLYVNQNAVPFVELFSQAYESIWDESTAEAIWDAANDALEEILTNLESEIDAILTRQTNTTVVKSLTVSENRRLSEILSGAEIAYLQHQIKSHIRDSKQFADDLIQYLDTVSVAPQSPHDIQIKTLLHKWTYALR
ncbi:MAG: hypothetical protein D6735_07230, partial [Acidobacteria bacterium]